jgi:DNA-binding NarL/FixJ family response regulator
MVSEAIQVLIVENDPRVLAALRTFLSSHSEFEIIGEAGDAAAALRLARSRTPAVALVDVLLPDTDDGLRLLRTLTGELGIPSVAISIDSGVRCGALAAGAYRFLEKDGLAERLTATLSAAAREPRGGAAPNGRSPGQMS